MNAATTPAMLTWSRSTIPACSKAKYLRLLLCTYLADVHELLGTDIVRMYNEALVVFNQELAQTGIVLRCDKREMFVRVSARFASCSFTARFQDTNLFLFVFLRHFRC